MPGGVYDSSKTRVRPVFDILAARPDGWIGELLTLPGGGCADARVPSGDFRLLEEYWEPRERALNPPVALLSWLIRHSGSLTGASSGAQGDRQRLLAGDPTAIEDALRRLRTEGESRAWYIFEGPTCPDVFLVTPDALIVIEGKRTEPTATTDTTWLRGRHQIWRHIDAAWEIRGRRAVYGFFIVEAAPGETAVPQHWTDAAAACLTSDALRSSFPHRSEAEAKRISQCFLGVATWRQVCDRFRIDWRSLPDRVTGVAALAGSSKFEPAD